MNNLVKNFMAGNRTIQYQNVTILDTQEPELICLESLTVDINSESGYQIQGQEFDPLFVSDDCELATIKNNLNNSSTLENYILPEGKTEITWIATDKAGNQISKSFFVKVLAPLSTNYTEKIEIELFPNPTTGIFSVYGVENNVKLEVTNIAGKVIISVSDYKQGSQIDLDKHSAGIYYIKISKNEYIQVLKLIKE